MGVKLNPLIFSGFDFTGTGSSGTVSSVALLPGSIGSVSNPTSTPIITINKADATHDGYLSSIDWNTFNNKQNALGFTPENATNKGQPNGYAPLDGSGKVPYINLPNSIMTFKGAWDPTTNTPTLTNGVGLSGDTYRASVNGASTSPIVDNWFAGDFIIYNGTIWQRSPLADGVISVNGMAGAVTLVQGNLTETTSSVLTITGGTNAVWGSGTAIQVKQSSGSQSGYLSSTDWSTFNSKQSALTPGSISTTTTGITILNGANSTVGPNVTIDIATASTSTTGLLTAIDWNTFNNKQPAGNYITALTGEVTATGPGSVTATVSNAAVIGKVLTGFVSGPNSPVVATDSILQGFEKLQAQVTAAGGTVTSVALADGSTAPIYTISGSPVTSTGTLTFSLNTQSANTIFAGPSTGVAAQPTFRSLVAADIPLISLISGVSGILPLTNGGTNSALTASNGSVVYSTATALALSSVGSIGQVLKSNGAAAPTWITVATPSAGDLNETTFNSAASQTAQPVTGFAFANGVVRSFRALVSVTTASNLMAQFQLDGIQKSASWEMSSEIVGDSTTYSFSINSSGQVLYTSGATTAVVRFRAVTTTV